MYCVVYLSAALFPCAAIPLLLREQSFHRAVATWFQTSVPLLYTYKIPSNVEGCLLAVAASRIYMYQHGHTTAHTYGRTHIDQHANTQKWNIHAYTCIHILLPDKMRWHQHVVSAMSISWMLANDDTVCNTLGSCACITDSACQLFVMTCLRVWERECVCILLAWITYDGRVRVWGSEELQKKKTKIDLWKRPSRLCVRERSGSLTDNVLQTY